LKLIKNKNFLLFLFGQGTSSFGTNLLHYATAFYILDLTGSPSKYASIIALAMLPGLFLGPIAGTVTDRFDRKKLIIFGDLARGILDIFLFGYSFYSDINIGTMYFLVLFLGSCEVFFNPAFTTILPSVVSREQLSNAISIKRTVGRVISVASPIIGAVIFRMLGFRIILLIDGLTYLVSSFSELFIEIPTIEKATKSTSFFKECLQGFRNISVDKRIKALLINNLLTNLFLLSLIATGFPYLIMPYLRGTEFDYGTVQSVATLGAILSVFAVINARRKYSIEKCLSLGLMILLFSCTLTFPLMSNDFVGVIRGNSIYISIFFSIIIFIFYISNSFWNVFYSSFYQLVIPLDSLGKYVGIESSYVAIVRIIGIKLFGYLFESYEPIVPIIVLSIGIIMKLVTHMYFTLISNRITNESILTRDI